MRPSATQCSLLSSLLAVLVILTGCRSVQPLVSADGTLATALLPASGAPAAQWQVAISMRQADLTGICLLKTDADTVRGTLVNEFGIRALSFIVSPGREKVQLRELAPFLDHWYIRRTLRDDLRFLFRATSADLGTPVDNRLITRNDRGGLTLTNVRRGIVYEFSPMAGVPEE